MKRIIVDVQTGQVIEIEETDPVVETTPVVEETPTP